MKITEYGVSFCCCISAELPLNSAVTENMSETGLEEPFIISAPFQGKYMSCPSPFNLVFM